MRTRCSFGRYLCLFVLVTLALAACGPAAAPEPTQAVATTLSPAPTQALAATALETVEAIKPTTAPTTVVEPTVASGQISENVGTFAVSYGLPSMDPLRELTTDHVIGFNVYDTLTRWDPEKGVIPWLAESWESNADGTEWTFHLRKGVKFHDGTPLTAQAAKFSYERSIELGLMAYYFADFQNIEAVDDYTLRITLTAPKPVPTLLSAGYGMFIINPNAADKTEDWYTEGHDSGSGPYLIESAQPGVQIVLDRFKDYWGGWREGQFTKVVIKVVADAPVREQMIRSGDADVTMELPYESFDSLKATGQINVLPAPVYAQYIYQFHITRPAMSDLRVRQALAYSFPYEDVQKVTYGGHALVAQGLTPVGLWKPPADWEGFTYDPEKARQLLTDAGLSGGLKLKLAIIVGDENRTQQALLWQAELAKLGVELQIESITNEAWWDAVYNPDNEFDIMGTNWWGGYASPREYLLLYDENISFTPFTGYKNADFDALLNRALSAEATNAEQANDLYTQAQAMLDKDAVAIWALNHPMDFEFRANVAGLRVNPVYLDVVFWYDLSRR